MAVLKGLKPEKVFAYFEKLCSVPHGSGNTKIISDLCVSFAEELGLKYRQEPCNNVVIWKPAFFGIKPAIVMKGGGIANIVQEMKAINPGMISPYGVKAGFMTVPWVSSFWTAAAGALKASRQPRFDCTRSPGFSEGSFDAVTSPMAPPSSAAPIWNGGT